MNILSIIEKKKQNEHLTFEEIKFTIDNFLSEAIADYQMSAFLMAIYFNGMSDQEMIDLTKVMIASGDVIDLSEVSKPTVDKHSTGGVGDKVSLILTPMLASHGLAVAKMSGRGLGHTGGTLDKLESIPGFSIELTDKQFIKVVNEVGMSIIGQTKNLVPADKKMYSLRDVTATVDSIPLIASSIMSKKIASGAKTIILDVKYGEGAFMNTLEDAKLLADKLVMIGNQLGRKTIALVTNMNEPLGSMVGNSLEVIEAIATLNNNGPIDITNLCKQITSEFLLATDVANDEEEAMRLASKCLEDGSALDVFYQFIEAQGGDINTLSTLKVGEKQTSIVASSSGYIKQIDAKEVGIAAMSIGAGRNKYTDPIDHSVGVEVKVKVGQLIEVGDVLFTIYSHQNQDISDAQTLLQKSVTISEQKVSRQKLVEMVVK